MEETDIQSYFLLHKNLLLLYFTIKSYSSLLAILLTILFLKAKWRKIYKNHMWYYLCSDYYDWIAESWFEMYII